MKGNKVQMMLINPGTPDGCLCEDLTALGVGER